MHCTLNQKRENVTQNFCKITHFKTSKCSLFEQITWCQSLKDAFSTKKCPILSCFFFHCAQNTKCPSIMVVGQDWCLTSLSLTVLISRTVYSWVWVDGFYNLQYEHTYYTYVDWVSEHQGEDKYHIRLHVFSLWL